MSAVYIQVNFRQDFIMEGNMMNPDQTDLVPYCLQYKANLTDYSLQESRRKILDWR